MSTPAGPDPVYTVFIKLPFPRGDFVDPPPVFLQSLQCQTNAKCYRSNGMQQKNDHFGRFFRKPPRIVILTVSLLEDLADTWLISCRECPVRLALYDPNCSSNLMIPRATKFDVTPAFLLQQAAWLYERQLSEVRAQMRKVGASKSSAPSPVPTDSSGGETMKRTGSGGGMHFHKDLNNLCLAIHRQRQSTFFVVRTQRLSKSTVRQPSQHTEDSRYLCIHS